jgi:hypothetical protein
VNLSLFGLGPFYLHFSHDGPYFRKQFVVALNSSFGSIKKLDSFQMKSLPVDIDIFGATVRS